MNFSFFGEGDDRVTHQYEPSNPMGRIYRVAASSHPGPAAGIRQVPVTECRQAGVDEMMCHKLAETGAFTWDVCKTYQDSNKEGKQGESESMWNTVVRSALYTLYHPKLKGEGRAKQRAHWTSRKPTRGDILRQAADRILEGQHRMRLLGVHGK
ncbi:hypothetical protein SODALDRAFT_356708 [Sodiomyces alkalinus F11]|uniref:Uncharacterized protein n=1 Tax=Sodiomyces alkalinus (strain CBS 110278 / VKM F-3762 / F11) TaxID=1314773 RepID=A0A3N2Q245_SODAK|nr:hypothetical protein SODALDRAFT_356708 [Sodiomyces alkalinus F11]ROT40695.1 hypothetical protein SODALDRAFT_356708 [Sodiomyces alkalinus F11]